LARRSVAKALDICTFGDQTSLVCGEADPPFNGTPFANQNAPIKVLPFQGILCVHHVDF
jgi:hypothetical protein